MKLLSPSILSADFSKLGEEINLIEKAGADLIHVDVMDGHFVPNLTIGPAVVNSLVGKTNLPFDVHLMIENPERFIDSFVIANTEYITIHVEACTHIHKVIQQIKNHGVKAGLSLNPATPLSTLENIIEELDLVLLMSVNPGFGGQKFIQSTIKKIEKLSAMRKNKNLSFKIEVDGGINLENIKSVLDAGCDIIVVGAAIFSAKDPTKEAKEFVSLLNK
jgi:ribulose-phosphate 3-epimerase